MNAVSGLTMERLRSWQVFAHSRNRRDSSRNGGAVVSAGIGLLDEFASRSLSQLRGIVRAVPAMPAPEPTDDKLVEWLKDAVRLMVGGNLNGTVVTSAGVPIAGALAQCHGTEALTDERGRFRHGSSLGVPLLVTISHPEFGVKRVSNVRASPQQACRGVRFVFPKRRIAPRALSALKGKLQRLRLALLRCEPPHRTARPSLRTYCEWSAAIRMATRKPSRGSWTLLMVFLSFAPIAFRTRCCQTARRIWTIFGRTVGNGYSPRLQLGTSLANNG